MRWRAGSWCRATWPSGSPSGSAPQPAAVGILFAISNLLAAISFPVAAWLARRIGLIRTMVFTHIPANLFLIGAALAPTLPVAVVLILARAALSSMDVPARQSYTMAVVDPAERTATAGVTLAGAEHRPGAGSGPGGRIPHSDWYRAPLVAGGMVKITYDISLYVLFRSRPRPRRGRPRACRARDRADRWERSTEALRRLVRRTTDGGDQAMRAMPRTRRLITGSDPEPLTCDHTVT